MTTRNRNVRSVVRSVRPVASRPVVRERTRSVNVDSLVVDGVVRLLASREAWQGSMTELDSAVRRVLRRKNAVAGWPANPRGLRAVVDSVVPTLRRLGVKVRFGRTTDHARKRFVEFVR